MTSGAGGAPMAVGAGVRCRVLKKASAKQGAELTSAKLANVKPGAVVEVLEARGNRVRTSHGWLSIVASSGTVLLQPLPPPPDFRFPFPPYEIQTRFMEHLHGSLRDGAPGSPTIAVMESPTGTGKSLSIICSALTWVREARAAERAAAEGAAAAASAAAPVQTSAEPDWVQDFNPEQRRLDDKDFFAKEREKKLRRRIARRLQRPKPPVAVGGADPDDEFLLVQDGGGGGGASKKRSVGYGSSSSDSDDTASDEGERSESDEEGEEGRPQVLYCSRTHSQLAQFVREINKTTHRNAVHVTTLGSRRTFCINSKVRSAPSVAMMNERCADLRKQRSHKALKTDGGGGALMAGARAKKQPAGCGCSYSSRAAEQLFEQAASESIMDMEDLVTLGRKLQACPYYGTRRMAKSGSADVVCLPYSLLFRAEARRALGIKLKGRVIVVDEAHNLHDAINGMHSITVDAQQFEQAIGQLQRYQSRYASRLRPDNLQRINQTLRVLRAMAAQLTRPARPAAAGSAAGVGLKHPTIVGVNEYLFSAGIDHVNFFELLAFFDESQLVNKLSGFVLAATEAAQQPQPQHQRAQQAQRAPRVGAVREVVDLIKALTLADGHGRILTQPPSEGGPAQVRFLMLNPASFFTPLLLEVRAIVLAGGTMDPLPTLAADFFPTVAVDGGGLRHFSCGHVIDPQQLATITVCNGPTAVPLDFRASAGRDSDRMMDELGRLLRNICAVVKGGVVAFFPSYAYEAACNTRWQATGELGRIAAVKPQGLFREEPPDETKQQQESDAEGGAAVAGGVAKDADRGDSLQALLAAYSAAVGAEGSRGALMCCVVGGKLSEGINFSDDLGRCIVMVGMPYANPTDPELLERQRFAVAQAGGDAAAGREYYERLCMRAVNQCVGRAIRHRHDYAAIMLLDRRYARPQVASQLPTWITGRQEGQAGGAGQGAEAEVAPRVLVAQQYGAAQQALCRFFRARRQPLQPQQAS